MKTGCDCFDEAALRDHLLSRLSATEEARVIAHLNTCRICQETLESFAENRSGLLSAARRIGQATGGETGVSEELLNRLRDTGEWPSVEVELADYVDESSDPKYVGRIGHYVVHSIAGRGGMGIALKALDEKLGRIVCLKLLARELAASPMARRRFLREARAAAAIHSDHVVTVFAVEEHRGRPYMAM